MADGVSKYLGFTPAASAVNDALRSAVESQLYFIDAGRLFSDDMFQEFRKGIDAYIAEVRAADPRESSASDLHDGHLARLIELQSAVAKSEKDEPK